jgi:hypothetical protein
MKIQVTEDDALMWAVIPEGWELRSYYNTLDLPDDKVEWIRRVERERAEVQEYLEERMEEYCAAREAARKEER